MSTCCCTAALLNLPWCQSAQQCTLTYLQDCCVGSQVARITETQRLEAIAERGLGVLQELETIASWQRCAAAFELLGNVQQQVEAAVCSMYRLVCHPHCISSNRNRQVPDLW
jgi:hypothetical protein